MPASSGAGAGTVAAKLPGPGAGASSATLGARAGAVRLAAGARAESPGAGTTVSCWKASPLSEKVCWRRPLLAASVRAVVRLAAPPGRALTSTWASTNGDTACRGQGNSESARLGMGGSETWHGISTGTGAGQCAV